MAHRTAPLNHPVTEMGRSRLALALGLMLLAVVTVLLFYFVGGLRAEQRHRHQMIRHLAERFEEGTDHFYQQYIDVIRTLAVTRPILNHDVAESSRLCGALNKKYPDTVNFIAVGPDGRFFGSGLPFDPDHPPTVRNRLFFKAAAEGKPLFIMGPHVGPIHHPPVTRVVVPLHDADGHFDGLVGVSIRLAALRRHWATMLSGSGVEALIADGDGMVVSASADLGGLKGRHLPGALRRIQGFAGPVVLSGTAYEAYVSTAKTRVWKFVTLSRPVGPWVFFRQTRDAKIMVGLLAVLVAVSLILFFRERRSDRLIARTLTELRGEIVERKRATRALRESGMHLRSIYEAADTVAFVTTDLSGPEVLRIIDFSPGAEQMLGYDREEILDQPMTRLFADGMSASPVKILSRLLAGETGFSGEITLKRKDAETFPALLTIRPRRDSSGRIIGAVGVAIDISERVTLEQLRLAAESRFRQFFEMGNTGSGIISPDSRWLHVNGKLTSMLGYSVAELAGLTWMDLTHPEDIDESREWFEKLRRGEIDRYELDTRFIRKDGETVYARLQIRSIRSEDGALDIVLGSLIDMTETRHLQQRLRHAEKMESIGTLAGGIAHDFNNILGIVIGNAELALTAVPAGGNAERFLGEIQTASLRARDVIRQLLGFSRREEQSLAPMDAVSVIEESMRLIRSTLPTTIGIETTLPPSADAIRGDPTQIHQVLINLCTNAAHAMPQGGRLTVSVEEERILPESRPLFSELAPGRYLVLTVADTGCGIPESIQDRVFDPYFTTKSIDKGTGMGLAIVHGIVMRHGGAIAIDSAEDQGTRVRVAFPIVDGDPDPLAHVPEVLPRGSGTVLFVDDEPALVRIAVQLLENLGYRAVPETDPEAALARFQQSPETFDCLITDMIMPGMTGETLAAAIRRIRPSLPIVLTTGFSEDLDAAEAANKGFQGFIQKPMNKRDLATILDAVIGSDAAEMRPPEKG